MTDSGIDICPYRITARYNRQYSILFSSSCTMLFWDFNQKNT